MTLLFSRPYWKRRVSKLCLQRLLSCASVSPTGGGQDQRSCSRSFSADTIEILYPARTRMESSATINSPDNHWTGTCAELGSQRHL